MSCGHCGFSGVECYWHNLGLSWKILGFRSVLLNTIVFSLSSLEQCRNGSKCECCQRCNLPVSLGLLWHVVQKFCHLASDLLVLSVVQQFCHLVSLSLLQSRCGASPLWAAIMLLCFDDAKPLGDMIDHLSTSTQLLRWGGRAMVKLPQFTHLITPPS